jgi:hypothetical protein
MLWDSAGWALIGGSLTALGAFGSLPKGAGPALMDGWVAATVVLGAVGVMFLVLAKLRRKDLTDRVGETQAEIDEILKQ